MSARKISNSASLQQAFTVQAREAHLSLSQDAVLIHKSGIEFRSPTPFSPWTEMTITLESPDEGRVNCAGVVIGCTGNKHTGYHVSMVFTNLSRQAQSRLSTMAAVSLR
ncbi:MAG TPA: PilZ domain-containing protein [Verrucomicrobiae bacterium]|nr:PilZ domain-containing protein [Verrucomicrobiae bacterium]